jgi:hypothetical protein
MQFSEPLSLELVRAADKALSECCHYSDVHPTVSVHVAAGIVMAALNLGADSREEVLKLVCQRALRRGYVLVFAAE